MVKELFQILTVRQRVSNALKVKHKITKAKKVKKIVKIAQKVHLMLTKGSRDVTNVH